MGLNGNNDYELLTLAELATLAKQSRWTLERRIKDGKLEARRLPGSRAKRVTLAEARRYLDGEAIT